MINLVTNEINVLNGLTQFTDPGVKLGDKVQEIIGTVNGLVPPPPEDIDTILTGTPVNAVAARETLTFTGVVTHGETVEIGDDIYEFAADDLQTVTRPEFIPVDISTSTGKATGTLTLDVQPTVGDTITIGTKVYIFVPVGTDTADGEVSIGADLAEAQAALVAAINGTDGVSDPHPLVSASDFALDAMTLSALIGGTAGNAIATTETLAAVTNIFAAGLLGGGTACTAANAITALVAAIAASGTAGVGATDGNGDTIVLVADVAGSAGNDIPINETLANATFTGGATKLSGGINGTLAIGKTFMVDASYLYVALTGNPITGQNWRRVSLGTAF